MKARQLGLLLATFGSLAVACGGGSDKPGAGPAAQGAVMAMPDALIERSPEATLAWDVSPDGKIRLGVHTASCAPLGDAAGTVKLTRTSDGKSEDVKLARDAQTGLLVGDGPDLDPELTEVRYDVTAGGQPLRGTFFVPGKGTSALVGAAKDAPKPAVDAPAEPPGPHGGVVQPLGADKVEVVADTDTGVVRVYPLTPSLQKPGVIRLAIGGAAPRIVVLEPIGTGAELHFAAALDPELASAPLTLVVKDAGGATRVVLVGVRRGAIIEIGADAAPHRYWSRRAWGDELRELGERARERGDDKDKAVICHMPPGNPGNEHTLSVGASAVAAHLAHGDRKGPCGATDVASGDKGGGPDDKGGSSAKGGGPDDKGGSSAKGGGPDDKGGGPDDKGASGDKGASDKGGGNVPDKGKSGDKGKGH